MVCGVPQGSILGPLMFLIFVNDLPDVVSKCTVNLYADDTTIYYANKDPKEVTNTLNADLSSIVDWIERNRLKMNINKTQLMILGRKACEHQCDQLCVNVRGINVAKSDQIKYLGVTVDSDLSWKAHIAKIRQKAFAALASIRRASHFLPSKTCKTMYNSTVLPHLDYCSTVWHSCRSTLSQSIERIQNYAMQTILKKPLRTPSAPLRERLNWTTLHQRRHKFMLYQVHRCVTKQAPPYLAKKFKKNSTFYSHTHGAEKLHLSRPSSEYYRQSFEFQGALNYVQAPNRHQTNLHPTFF